MRVDRNLFLYVSALQGIERIHCSLGDLLKIYLVDSPDEGHCPENFDYELVNIAVDNDDATDVDVDRTAPLNLQPEISHVRVFAPSHGNATFARSYMIADIIERTLKKLMASSPVLDGLLIIGYSFKPLDLVLKTVKPKVSGEFSILHRRRRAPAFHVRTVSEDELQIADIEDWGVAGAGLTDELPVAIFLRPHVARELGESMPMSSRWEEGGFLLGRAYRRAGTDARYIIDVFIALPAKHTSASPTRLAFTADSFAELQNQIANNFQDAQILGWYHSHLFPATDEFGLSSFDEDLHKSIYKLPWQVAGLVNFEMDGTRTLRFYGMEAGSLVEWPIRVADMQNGDRDIITSSD